MTSNSFTFVYIGNTSSLNDRILFDYCSRFGTVVSSLVKNENFCDFHLIEFATIKEATDFVRIPTHQIDRLVLDVKSYKDFFAEIGLLNIDRKCFIGPIVESKEISIVVAFYREIDSKVSYRQTRQDQEKYLLLEFSSRHYASKVFDKQVIPVVSQQRKLILHKPVHPKEFLNRTVTMENRLNQIYIHGLIDRITEKILIDYFNRRATVVSCRILRDDSKCAVLQLTDENSVKKILDVPEIILLGVRLTLRKAPPSIVLLSCPKEESDSINTDQKVGILPLNVTTSDSSHVQNHPFFQNFANNPEPQPEDHSGWTSPRRTIEERLPAIDVVPVPSSSTPLSQTKSKDSDLTSTQKTKSNNLLHFFENFQNDLDQIKDEYRYKFQQDRIHMNNEIDQLIDEQRRAMEKLDRYLSARRHEGKRKYSKTSID